MLVKPSSVIRSDYKNFSKLCHETDDPIVITNNGENDLVVMTHEAFCRRDAWIRLQAKLASADKQIMTGNLVDHAEVFARLKERVHDEASARQSATLLYLGNTCKRGIAEGTSPAFKGEVRS